MNIFEMTDSLDPGIGVIRMPLYDLGIDYMQPCRSSNPWPHYIRRHYPQIATNNDQQKPFYIG